MRDELKRIGVRAVRITLAIFLAGVSLHAGFNALRTQIQQHVFAVQVRTPDETYMRDHGISPKARIARRIVVDATAEQLSATQALVIRHDPGLCNAIHGSLLRGKNNVPSTPAEWALGSLNIDGYYVPFEANNMTNDEAADACSVTAVANESKLFRDEDNVAAPSDIVRYRNYEFRANTLDVLFRANGVRVEGVTKAATSQQKGVTTFTWKSDGDLQQMREADFKLTRPVGAQRKISDVVTRVDENWLPYLTPPLTAILVALPYALFVVFGRRHARPERARLIGMGEWLLTLYLIVHLTFAVVQMYDWLTQNALSWLKADSFLGGETFGALLASFACIVWPLLIARWTHNGHRSWISEPGPVVPRSALIAAIVFALWAGVAGYSRWGAALPAIVIVAFAIAAFVACCWWLMREIGGGIFHTIVLIGVTTILYLARDRFAFWITWPLAALFLLSLLLLVRAAFNARPVRFLRFVIVLLVCLLAAKLLLPPEFFTPYWELHELVDASNDLALFAILAAFLLLLRDHSESGAPSIRALRLGFALALSFFYTARYGLVGAVVFILGYLLLRYGLFIPRWRRVWQQLDANTIRAGVAKVIAMHEAERALDGLRKNARAEVAEGKKKWAEYEKLTREMEAVVAEYRKDEAAFTASSRALARGSTEPPWKRGLYAARIAAFLAIPWVFVYVAVASHRDIPTSPQWWLQIFATFIFAAIQWPLYGFFFAYFYPEIRGDNGLSKSLVYFVTIVVPPFLAFVIFNSDQNFELFALWMFQNFIQAMVLGLFAGDYRTLKEFGLSWRHLRDVHNLGVLSAYGSSIIVAVGGAITTAAATGVVDLLRAFFAK